MKQLFNLIILCLAVSLLSACGEKKITVKGADGTEYESYQECCAAQDFQAAHQYLAKMQNDEDFKGDYYSAKEFVFKQEALYLMSLGDETSKKRIVYLLKEEGGNDNHVDMLVDLAIDADDEEFVKVLTKQYEGSISSDMLRKIVEFLYIEKGDGNLEFVQTLLNRYNKSGLLLDAAVEKGDEELLVRLAKQYNGTLRFQTFKSVMDFLSSQNSSQYLLIRDLLLNKVIDSEELFLYALDNKLSAVVNKLCSKYVNINDNSFITTLASKNDRIVSDAIIMALSKVTIPGRAMSKGLHDYYDGCRDCYSRKEVSRPHFQYTDGIIDYNTKCSGILEIAIGAGNQYLAQKVLMCFKQNIETMKGGGSGEKAPDGTRVDGNHCYVYYTNSDKNEAQKKYQDAVRSGAFK